ncbi:glycoside hydrolase [Dendrothele bispora CBS 962.96]|uniref:Probable beta-glucosidase G n=1 Tax=Dendrothele bispora (strain CBS 962.96) TaxID=1314807 RepID=A0A4S8LVC7_DENBC|nr:glycoside hydrolase [Dendrothele bispora CBS 962.96]
MKVGTGLAGFVKLAVVLSTYGAAPASAESWTTPIATGGKSWKDAFAKASSLVNNMTLAEKVNVMAGIPGSCVGNIGGVPRLNISGFCLEDGPAGVRPLHGVSQFPAGLTTAATWDRELIYNRSYFMGKEYYDQGVHIALAPVTGGPLGRAPLGGRNWEGWSPDPYATGVASYLSVLGIQDAGVMATAKHFIGYEQETFRNPYNLDEAYSVFPAGVQAPISSNIDDKTMHEVYLWPFAEAVRAGVAHVMCSYNNLNGTQACENSFTLSHLLKTELNFQGSVISDWGGQHNDVDTLMAGLDMAMPGSGFGGLFGQFWSDLVQLVENGTVPEDRVTDAALRILTPYIWLGQDETPLPEHVFNALPTLWDAPDVYRDVRQDYTAELIRKIGAESATLLKNTGGLPLQNPQRIAVLGNDATDNALGQNACGGAGTACPLENLNGTLTLGGGSGYAYAPYVVTPLDALKQRAIHTGAEISSITVIEGYDAAVQSLVPTSDVTVVFVSGWSTEFEDRPGITLDNNADALVAAAVNSSSNVVVVMHIPGVVDIEKWADNENVTAIVAAWYPGQETGNAIADVLYGAVNPSGKLPFTWAKSLDDYYPNTIVSDPVLEPQSDFTDGVFIDYRWFDAQNITPRYEFGFGLSYTTFEYSGLILSEPQTSSSTLFRSISLNSSAVSASLKLSSAGFISDSDSLQDTAEPFADFDGSNSLYDVVLEVTATVSNTGESSGSEVAQLYVSIPGDGQPVRVLRGFDKAKDIAPGASSIASFELRRKDLSVWNPVKQAWEIPKGQFIISVGASSRDLPLSETWSRS